jgi:predicted small lipoprotein YifL
MKPARTVIVVSAFCALVAGCGMKGSLYVPGVPATAPWPYPTPTPAPQKPQPKPADVPPTSDDKK